MSNYTSVAMLRCREPIDRAEPLKNALALDFSAIGEKMSDYWFDRTLRHGARDYNGAWGSSCDHSWNFYGGIALTASF